MLTPEESTAEKTRQRSIILLCLYKCVYHFLLEPMYNFNK